MGVRVAIIRSAKNKRVSSNKPIFSCSSPVSSRFCLYLVNDACCKDAEKNVQLLERGKRGSLDYARKLTVSKELKVAFIVGLDGTKMTRACRTINWLETHKKNVLNGGENFKLKFN